MELNSYRSAIAQFIREQALPVDKFLHQPRLYELAKTVAGEQAYDDDVLYAAAWLHDLGVFIGHRPEDPMALAAWDHITYALREVPRILQSLGFPQDKIPEVCHAIASHLPSGQPTTFEAVVLRDADILEQLGAIGILRTVSKVGRDTRFRTHQDAVRSLGQAAASLPAQLRLPAAKQLAVKRVAAMAAFFAAIEGECRVGQQTTLAGSGNETADRSSGAMR